MPVSRNRQEAAVGQKRSGAKRAVTAGELRAHSIRSTEIVFELLDERMQVVRDIAAWKWVYRKPLRDRAREKTVIGRAMIRAAEIGLSRRAVKSVFELQIACALQLQSKLHREWQVRGFTFSHGIASLEDELRPRLDHLGERLLIEINAAVGVLSGPRFIQDWSGRATTLLSLGWSETRRRQLMFALASIRSSIPAARQGSGARNRRAMADLLCT